MALDTNKLVTLGQLTDIIKPYIDNKDAMALKSMDIGTNGVIKFFKTEDGSGEPAYTVTLSDLIKDKYLDLTKTSVVNSFVWSDTEYPNSTDPNLDGKPVVVFAVTDETTVTYSFASLVGLIDVYTGDETNTSIVTVSGDNKISVEVKVSSEYDNILTVVTENGKEGIYVPPTDTTSKADKLTGENIKENAILLCNDNGNILNSGKTIDEIFSERQATDDEVADIFNITIDNS